jgi:regulator of cell morphogenesis and NO signaling
VIIMNSETYNGKTVGELVAERFERARVFERFGIDYCCGGRKSLVEACTRAKLELDDIVAALIVSDEANGAAGAKTDWSGLSMSELVDDIVGTHHAYLRETLPRIEQITQKVAEAHGARHPETIEIMHVFAALEAELFDHMMKEEEVLFPWIKQADAGEAAPFHCGSVVAPISMMEHEHDHAGRALERLNKLTNGYQPPEDACATWTVMLQELARLEADMHVHIHKENNILFPRALRTEREIVTLSTSA